MVPRVQAAVPDVLWSWRRPLSPVEVSARSVSRVPDGTMPLGAEADVVPAVNQIETHPFHQQIKTQTFLQANGVQHEA